MSNTIDSNWTPRRASAVDWLIVAALFGGSLALLALTGQMGFPRDETFYFRAGNDYAGWFTELYRNFQAGELWTSFTRANVDKHWSYNSEHPALMKTLFGLSDLLFAEYLEWISPSAAMRLPGMATGAALVSVTYLLARQAFGRLAGLVAGLALLFQPRFFFHAHLACFDVPITCLWVWTVYAYWRSFDSNAWAVGTGVAWGVALSTKLNAFFLPVVLTGHWILTNWKDVRLRRTDAGPSIRLPAMPRGLIWMAVLGPVLFYAMNPRFWFDTANRVGTYLAFHLQHVNYFVYYFGQNVQHPPLPVSYPWVMTVLTVPATILLAAGLGGVYAGLRWDPVDWGNRWRRALADGQLPDRNEGDSRGTALLLVINLLFPIALISDPQTPIFGGTKHWMPAMPFLAIFAGAGVTFGYELLRDRWAELSSGAARRFAATATGLALTAAVAGPAAYATARIHPFGTSYYNEIIGSIRGAADHKMFRQFWGYTSRQALPWLNDQAKQNARVWTHNTTGFGWWHYKHEDMARDDLNSSGISRSDYALFHHQKHFITNLHDVWDEYETYTPAHVVAQEGVPLLSLYRRPKLLDRDTPPAPADQSDPSSADTDKPGSE